MSASEPRPNAAAPSPAPAPSDASRGARLRLYSGAWLVLTLFLAREYAILNQLIRGRSVFKWLHAHHLLAAGEKLSPDAGQSLSYKLGWIGFGIICLTNLYVLRKRWPALKNTGSPSSWLDFHILCGLVGPTLILFHTNFKIGGLVAISFWSMVISFASGIVGRYLYVQLLGQREEMKARLDRYDLEFKAWRASGDLAMDDETFTTMKQRVLAFVGVDAFIATDQADLVTVLMQSVAGDLRRHVRGIAGIQGVPKGLRRPLLEYSLVARRYLTMHYFRRLMGYWHAFHQPFAIFMYVVTVFHIVAALLFRVNH